MCELDNPCGYTCGNGFTLFRNGDCVCESPNAVCGGQCRSSCPSAIVTPERRAASAFDRVAKRRRMCPRGYTACGIFEQRGRASEPWECVDVRHDLESCKVFEEYHVGLMRLTSLALCRWRMYDAPRRSFSAGYRLHCYPWCCGRLLHVWVLCCGSLHVRIWRCFRPQSMHFCKIVTESLTPTQTVAIGGDEALGTDVTPWIVRLVTDLRSALRSLTCSCSLCDPVLTIRHIIDHRTFLRLHQYSAI